jgi:MoaA/NifB/PqqE/SkfB family radical SAM enzyme
MQCVFKKPAKRQLHFGVGARIRCKHSGRYPSMLELELNNTCNLECVMCIGELSSSIRKNREKLPAIRSPYDEAFVEPTRRVYSSSQRNTV